MAGVKLLMREYGVETKSKDIPKGKKNIIVRIRYQVKDHKGVKTRKELKYSTDKKIDTKYWNPKTERARDIIGFTDREKFNEGLTALVETVNSIYNDLAGSGEQIDNDILRAKLDKGLLDIELTDTAPKPQNILQYAKWFKEQASIRRVKKTTKKGKKEPVVKSTIVSYQNTINHLEHFEKLNRKYRFSDIDKEFMDKFISHLEDVEKISYSTMAVPFKNLKNFAKYARLDGVKVSDFIFSDDWQAPTESKQLPKVFLTPSEIKRVYAPDFEDETLDNVRDTFMIALLTGLRISDFSKLNAENIVDGKFVIDTQKTDKKVKIAIHPFVKQILEKRGGQLPKMVSSQKFNQLIKVICKEVGINQKMEGVVQKRFKGLGNRNVVGIYPKYMLISSKAGRKSFATNNFGKLKTVVIMAALGHSKESTTFAYIGDVSNDFADEMEKEWSNDIDTIEAPPEQTELEKVMAKLEAMERENAALKNEVKLKKLA